jgi:hypothetical protein
MGSWSAALFLVLAAFLVGACGGNGDDSADRVGRSPERARPEATIARWVKQGDCGLMTDRYEGFGYRSVAEGRRICQIEADKTPVESYRVESTRVDGDDASVVLALDHGRRYTFWLVARGRRGWAIDGYEERRPRDGAVGATEVMAAFERHTGKRLDRMGETSTPSYQTLGFRELEQVVRRGEDAPRGALALVERYGAFVIYVAQDAAEAKRLMRGGSSAEKRGIHYRRYANVVLDWPAGESEWTDRRFDLLDEILRGATRTAG